MIRWLSGACALCVLVVTTSAAAQSAIALQNAMADFSQGGYPVADLIDGDIGTALDQNGWAVAPQISADHVATMETQTDFSTSSTVVFSFNHNLGSKLVVGLFRLSYTTDPRGSFGPSSGTWTVLDSADGSFVSTQGDYTGTSEPGGRWFTSGTSPKSVFEVRAPVLAANITGFRLETFTDARFPMSGSGWHGTGNFALSELEAFGTPETPQLSADSSAIFGATALNSTSSADVTITNPGGLLDVVVSEISVVGSDADMFTVTAGTCGSLTPTLAAGESCALALTFQPTAVGNRTASLRLASDDPSSPALVTLSGGAGATIPTLSEWGMMVLFAGLVATMAFGARRRASV